MNRVPLSVPEIAIIAGTRAAFGAGVGMLIAGRLGNEQRRAVGWTLLAIGALSTIPIATQLLRANWMEEDESEQHGGRLGRSEYVS